MLTIPSQTFNFTFIKRIAASFLIYLAFSTLALYPLVTLASETNYFYLDPKDPSTLFGISDENGFHYVISDPLGSPSLILDEQGNVEQKLDYDPFGIERINEINRQNNPSSFTSPFSFTGQRKDLESDLLYYGARYYNPEIGRFTQPDPMIVAGNQNDPRFQNALMNPQLLNPYSYAGNNPITNVDENGESTKKAWLLNPVGTFMHIRMWAGFSRVYFERVKGYQISADLLDRSLTLNPIALNVTGSNEYAYIAKAVQASPEYQRLITGYITDAEKNNETQFRKFLTNEAGQETTNIPLEFNTGDLATALHGTQATHVRASKQTDGSWEVSTAVLDTYNFEMKNYKNDRVLNTGNNVAVLSQGAQAISPYQVNITFNHRVQLNPRKPP